LGGDWKENSFGTYDAQEEGTRYRSRTAIVNPTMFPSAPRSERSHRTNYDRGT
jgi:hypothetical protein